MPAGPYHPPGPGPVRRRQQRRGSTRQGRPVVVDLVPLDRMPVGPFDTGAAFADLTFQVRAPYCAEHYYILDLANRAYSNKVALWCYLLVPHRHRDL